MRYLYIDIWVLTLSLVLVACAPNGPSVTLEGADGQRVSLMVEIADDPQEHRTGLMHREDLTWDSGMLFVFEDEGVRSFWMKNTKIPLDIIFFNGGREFVSMETMQPCLEDPCPSYLSKGPAKYAVEVNAGFTMMHQIDQEWTMSYTR